MDTVHRSSASPCPLSALGEAPREFLQQALEQTIDALSCIDANQLESLALGLEERAVAASVEEARRAAASHRVLALLLKETGGHLRMLSRVTEAGCGVTNAKGPENETLSLMHGSCEWQR